MDIKFLFIFACFAFAHLKFTPICCRRRSSRCHGQDSATQDGLHLSAAAGTGKTVQDEQVPVQAKALRSGHFINVDRNAGNI